MRLYHKNGELIVVVQPDSTTRNLCSISFRFGFNSRSDYMENAKDEKNASWMSVPQFGDWDQKGPLPDYSMDFSKIREMRKQNKRELSRTSIGNEEDLVSSNKIKLDTQKQNAPLHHYSENHHSPNNKRSLLSCFNCCVKA